MPQADRHDRAEGGRRSKPGTGDRHANQPTDTEQELHRAGFDALFRRDCFPRFARKHGFDRLRRLWNRWRVRGTVPRAGGDALRRVLPCGELLHLS